MVSPHRIELFDVQLPICPYCRVFGATDLSGLSRPSRFRSPYFSSDGFSQTSGVSSTDSSRTPRPPYKRLLSVPASQNDTPLDATPRPPTTVFNNELTSPLDASFRDAQKFTLPAPAPIRPPFDTYVAPFWIASFTCAGESPGVPCSSSATPPLTIGAAMLV